MPSATLDALTTVARLEEVPALAERILAGQTAGRIVVTVA